MKLLVLVGSLRTDSFNAQLADAALAQLPTDADVEVLRFDRLAELPFYSEDLESAGAFPAVVDEFRSVVADADAILVATPEYNGSVSGVIKNAIDVASRPRGEASVAGKPVAVIAASASPHAALWAREAMVRILTVAGATPLETHVGVGSAYNAAPGELVDARAQEQLRDLMAQLVEARELAAV